MIDMEALRLPNRASKRFRKNTFNAKEPSMDQAATDVREHIAFLLEVCSRRGYKVLAEYLREFEISAPGCYYILLSIANKNNLSQKHLSDYLCINVNTMTRYINQLERSGLAARHENPENRKENLLKITPKGKRVAKEALAKVSKLRERAYGDISKEERNTLHRILTKLFLSGGPRP